MAIRGVAAPGEFRDDSRLVDYRGRLARGLPEIVAHTCASNNKLVSRQADHLTNASEMKWTPLWVGHPVAGTIR